MTTPKQIQAGVDGAHLISQHFGDTVIRDRIAPLTDGRLERLLIETEKLNHWIIELAVWNRNGLEPICDAANDVSAALAAILNPKGDAA